MLLRHPVAHLGPNPSPAQAQGKQDVMTVGPLQRSRGVREARISIPYEGEPQPSQRGGRGLQHEQHCSHRHISCS